MITFTQVLSRHLERKLVAGCSAMSAAKKSHVLRRFVGWLAEHAGVVAPAQLTSEHLADWLVHLRARRNKFTGVPLRPATRDMEIHAVRSFCKVLIAEGQMSGEVLTSLSGFRPSRLLPKPTPRHVEVRQFLRQMPVDTPRAYMLRAMAELLYTSGMRPCELLALDVDDLELERGLAKVTGKGNKQRMVPIGRTAQRYLGTYLSIVRPTFLRAPTERALWLNQRGCRLRYQGVLAGLHRSFTWEKSTRVTCYTFRRACATEMIRSGASLWAVKELLGHEQLETLKHYVQLTIFDLQRTHARCHPRDTTRVLEDTLHD